LSSSGGVFGLCHAKMPIFGAVWLLSAWRPNACAILLLFAPAFFWRPSPASFFSSAVGLVQI